MTDPDQLPALPMRTLREEIAYQQAKGFCRNSIDLQTLLAWLGAETAAIESERARADSLQAENTELKAELKTVYQHHADEEARADALEAALRAERERWEAIVKRLLPMAEDSLMRPELDVVCLDARAMLTRPMMSADGGADIPL